MKILYIAGATRSGSTLFHDIMSQLEGFEGVGELRDIWHYGLLDNRLCGCGRPFRSCEYWRSILDEAFGSEAEMNTGHWASLTEQFRTRDLLFSSPRQKRELLDQMDPLLRAVTSLYAAIEAKTGCRVIVDSSKNPAFGYLIGTAPELEVRYVHLVRDAPAVAYSLSKRKESEPGRRLPRKTPWRASADWLFRNLAIEQHLRSQALVRMRYEDLVADPVASVARVCGLMSERCDASNFVSGDQVEMSIRPHSVFGNPGRFRKGPTVLRTDDEWHRAMDRRAASTVRLLTFPLRLRYGYARRRPLSS